MKFLKVCLFTAAMLCSLIATPANPLRFPIRAFYASTEADVNLEPLYEWWSTNQNFIASLQQGTNPPATVEQIASLLPPRPLDRWVRITATNFATFGDGWTMPARLEDYPGHAINRPIFLKHPPGRDRVNFLWIQANQAQISLAISNARIQVQTSTAEANAARVRAQNFGGPSTVLAGDLATTAAQLNNVANEDFKYAQETQRTLAELTATQTAIDAFNAELDGEPFYKLDFFALDTGFTNGVLPVFDLGELRTIPLRTSTP